MTLIHIIHVYPDFPHLSLNQVDRELQVDIPNRMGCREWKKCLLNRSPNKNLQVRLFAISTFKREFLIREWSGRGEIFIFSYCLFVVGRKPFSSISTDFVVPLRGACWGIKTG